MKKYAVVSSGIVYAYFENIVDAEKFILQQQQSFLKNSPTVPNQTFKIVKVEKVYKLTQIDENQNETIHGFREVTSDSDEDYNTMFDELDIYGDGYGW